MFIASFNPANGAPFIADKNGNMPFIGNVQAGTYFSSIVNGTMFSRAGYKTGQLYLCQNVAAADSDGVAITTSNGDQVYNVEIIAEVSVLEYVELRTKLGAPRKAEVAVKAEVEAETELV